MASGTIKSDNSTYLNGEIALNLSSFNGYVTGSGNYFSFMIPMFNPIFNSASADISQWTGSVIYDDKFIPLGAALNFDLSYCVINKRKCGINVELKFAETQTSNRVGVIAFNNSVGNKITVT